MEIIFLLIAGFLPSLFFYLLGWLTIGASLLMGLFLLIAFKSNLVLYVVFLVAYISAAIATILRADKKSFSSYLQYPSSRRNIVQIFANQSLFSLWALIYIFFPNEIFISAYLGSIAAVLADKFASEIGSTSKNPPKLMLSRQTVPPGTSGARSTLGFLAELTSSVILGVLATILFFLTNYKSNGPSAQWLLITILGGILGSLTDSFLGATVQAQYICSICQKQTERLTHCDTATKLIKGIPWMNNQSVNFLAALAGGLIGIVVSLQITH